jgi:hypothetical protein
MRHCRWVVLRVDVLKKATRLLEAADSKVLGTEMKPRNCSFCSTLYSRQENGLPLLLLVDAVPIAERLKTSSVDAAHGGGL